MPRTGIFYLGCPHILHLVVIYSLIFSLVYISSCTLKIIDRLAENPKNCIKIRFLMPKYDFRDISLGLQKFRDFLLGRKHTLHGRFPPLLAPRSLPRPDIRRGPEDKYADRYYYARSAKDTVLPPVVAPVAEGPSPSRDPTRKVETGGMKPNEVCFACAPTPGAPWWWDGHCYYECQPEPCPPCPPPCPPTAEERK